MSVKQKQIRLWSFLAGLLTLSIAAQTVSTSVLAAPVQSKAQTKSTRSNPTFSNPTFSSPTPLSPSERFERFRKESDPWNVLHDPQVKAAIHATMGNRDEEYWDRTQLLDDSYSRGDDLLIAGDVRGLAGSMVSLFYLNYSTGKLYVGYNDGTEIHLFGVKSKSEVPQIMNEYAKKNLAGKPIVFEVADWKRLKNKGVKTNAAPLNLAKLTGTYERKGNRFIRATLLVEQLPGSKIKFQIYANNGGNSGQAAGTIGLIDQCGSFKEAESKIDLKFNGGKVVVSGNDSYFCGNAVTLLGTYDKTSDQSPRFDND